MCALHQPRDTMGIYGAAWQEWAGLQKKHSLNLIAQLQIKQNLIPTLISSQITGFYAFCSDPTKMSPAEVSSDSG